MHMRLLLITMLLSNYLSSQQNTLPPLPPYFDYTLRTDSLLVLESNQDQYYLESKAPRLNIGCLGPIEISVAFSLSLSNEFLYYQYPNHFSALEGYDKAQPGFRFIIYGVAKQDPTWDSLLRVRLEDYCIYGQHNHYFQSREYHLFTYAHAMNGGGLVTRLVDLGLWSEFQQALVHWLDHIELHPFNLPALSEAELVAPDFDWRGAYLMYPRAFVNELSDLSLLEKIKPDQEKSPRLLKLRSNHRARSISNYNQPKGNWYRDKARWWRHQNLLYVWVEGWGLQAYRILAPGVLLNLEHHFAFLKSEE